MRRIPLVVVLAATLWVSCGGRGDGSRLVVGLGMSLDEVLAGSVDLGRSLREKVLDSPSVDTQGYFGTVDAMRLKDLAVGVDLEFGSASVAYDIEKGIVRAVMIKPEGGLCSFDWRPIAETLRRASFRPQRTGTFEDELERAVAQRSENNREEPDHAGWSVDVVLYRSDARAFLTFILDKDGGPPCFSVLNIDTGMRRVGP